MRSLAVLICIFFLSGCGLAARAEREAQMKAALETAIAEKDRCNVAYPLEQKTAMARAKCMGGAANILKPFVPYADLVDQENATRTALAEQWQMGRITQAMFEQQFTQAHSQVVAEEQRRNLASRSVGAQESAAAAAWRAASPVSCTRIGNTVNCY